MKALLKSLVLSATLLAGSVAGSTAATLVDTGSNPDGSQWYFASGQHFAGQVTLKETTTITSIEAYLDLYSAGMISVQVLSTAENALGSVLFKQSFEAASGMGLWQGITGAALMTLDAGTYWFAFVPSESVFGSWRGNAPNPLEEYAQGSTSSGWFYRPNIFDYLDVGLRVSGTAVQTAPAAPPAVPLPAGGLLLASGLALLVLRRKGA